MIKKIVLISIVKFSLVFAVCVEYKPISSKDLNSIRESLISNARVDGFWEEQSNRTVDGKQTYQLSLYLRNFVYNGATYLCKQVNIGQGFGIGNYSSLLRSSDRYDSNLNMTKIAMIYNYKLLINLKLDDGSKSYYIPENLGIVIIK